MKISYIIIFTALSLGAYFLPRLRLKIQTRKREEKMKDEALYFMDMLTITLEAGMNLQKAMEYISSNMKGCLSEEIRKSLKKTEYGLTLEEALGKLAESIRVDDFRSFVSGVKRAKKLGVSLSKTLSAQSELMRSKKIQKAEELSRTASVKISIPLVLFIFPSLLIIYLGPAILQLME